MKKKSKIISLLHFKGGVGKSCLSNILANEINYENSQQGFKQKVLLVDIDIQHTNANKRSLDLEMLKINIAEQKGLSTKQLIEIRQFQLRYAMLASQKNFIAYSLCKVDTNDNKTIDKAVALINSNEYDYVILDFPGTLYQPGTGIFYDMIEHLIIPITCNKSDVLATDLFMKELASVSYPSSMKTIHFLLNKYDVAKKRIIDELQSEFEIKYNIPFLHSLIRNAPSYDTNTILPLSVKINLSSNSIGKSSYYYLRELAQEIISITE